MDVAGANSSIISRRAAVYLPFFPLNPFLLFLHSDFRLLNTAD